MVNAVLAKIAENPRLLEAVTDDPEILDAITNEDKDIHLTAKMALDLQPTEDQQKSIDTGSGADIMLQSNSFKGNGKYLIVHESKKRASEIDYLVAQASNAGKLNFHLADMSPVAVAEITVVASKTAVSQDETNGDLVLDITDAYEKAQEAEPEESQTPWTLIIILIVVAGCGAFAAFYFLKFRKKGGSGHGHGDDDMADDLV